MPQRSTLRVEGYRQFLTACDNADKNTKREVRATFRKVGDAVKEGAAARFAGVDARTAAGFRTGVRRTGVSVQQSLRKTTGLHPEFGALQMRRALVPSLEANAAETERAFEQAIDKVCNLFERTP